MADFMTNYGIIICYILLGVATVAAVAFPVFELIKNPKGAKGALLGIGTLVVVVAVSYALSSDANPSKIEITASAAKQVDTGLYSLVYSEVSKLFK
jgi:hypothetical protein